VLTAAEHALEGDRGGDRRHLGERRAPPRRHLSKCLASVMSHGEEAPSTTPFSPAQVDGDFWLLAFGIRVTGSIGKTAPPVAGGSGSHGSADQREHAPPLAPRHQRRLAPQHAGVRSREARIRRGRDAAGPGRKCCRNAHGTISAWKGQPPRASRSPAPARIPPERAAMTPLPFGQLQVTAAQHSARPQPNQLRMPGNVALERSRRRHQRRRRAHLRMIQRQVSLSSDASSIQPEITSLGLLPCCLKPTGLNTHVQQSAIDQPLIEIKERHVATGQPTNQTPGPTVSCRDAWT